MYGEIDVVSMYCQWGSDIGPYLEYMDSAFRYASGASVLIVADMNAERLAHFSTASMNVEDVRVNYEGKLWKSF